MVSFQGIYELDGKKNTTLFSVTANWNLAFHSIWNVGNKVIYGLQTPKIVVHFNKFYCLYFTYLNTFFWEEVGSFHQISKGFQGT